jgi:predicted O-methyltransferase YrrM
MSKASTPVDEQLFGYIAAHTIEEDDFLRDLRVASLAAGLPEIHIAPEQAAFLRIALQAGRARTVVEVGTLGGYSAIAMARALPDDGRVITLEVEPHHAAFAREWIGRSDQRGKVEVRLGDAMATLPTLADESADAVFLDADKERYVDYLRQSMRILRRGGMLFADNVLADGEIAAGTSAKVNALRAFLDAAQADPGLHAVIVPLGDGCLFGVKQ